MPSQLKELSPSNEKLQILLIDDNPQRFWNDTLYDLKLPKQYRPFFSILWIRTPEEARYILDVYTKICIQAPEHILKIGLPPEILIFDYTLSQTSNKYRRKDHQSSNIINHLNDLIRELDITVLPLDPEDRAPLDKAQESKDKLGCFIGITYARSFSDYPCAAIPTTAHPENVKKNSIEDFFEWLNSKYLYNAFESRTRTTPNWEELINIGVQTYREKIKEFILAKLIRIPINELQVLINDPLTSKNSHFTIYCRLGHRRIPIAGLFIDKITSTNNDSDFIMAVKEWGNLWLEGLLKNVSLNEYSLSRKLADTYFKGYSSANSIARYNLSELIGTPDRDSEEEEEFLKYCDNFRISSRDVLLNPHNVILDKKFTLPYLIKSAENSSVARLSVLMLMVKAEMDPYNYAISVTVDEILKMIDPLPEKILTFLQSGPNFKKDQSKIIAALSRLKKTTHDGTTSSIALSIDKVLKPDSKKRMDKSGLLPEEAHLLRLYAHEIGFQENKWPYWLKTAVLDQ